MTIEIKVKHQDKPIEYQCSGVATGKMKDAGNEVECVILKKVPTDFLMDEKHGKILFTDEMLSPSEHYDDEIERIKIKPTSNKYNDEYIPLDYKQLEYILIKK